MAVFQKKIIIGSVLGFIVSAIGVVAVFFPSVFNLEKQKIEEKTIFLHTQKSEEELYEWLIKKQDSIIKLALFHCNGQGRDENARVDVNFGERETIWLNSELYLGPDTVSDMRENGFIQLGQKPAQIRFPKIQNDAVYDYYVSAISYDEVLNKKMQQICGSLKQGVSGLWGTFYVNAEYGDGLLIFTLDPMSKKDLKLRNY